jgi:hypothetical protein
VTIRRVEHKQEQGRETTPTRTTSLRRGRTNDAPRRKGARRRRHYRPASQQRLSPPPQPEEHAEPLFAAPTGPKTSQQHLQEGERRPQTSSLLAQQLDGAFTRSLGAGRGGNPEAATGNPRSPRQGPAEAASASRGRGDPAPDDAGSLASCDKATTRPPAEAAPASCGREPKTPSGAT